jgi:hypothetical protein
MNDLATLGTFRDFVRRLRLSVGWAAAQFWALALLLLAGLAWTRLPDKYAWQVFLSLLIPLLLIAALLVLEAGFLRRLLGPQEGRARFVTGALMLLAWAAVVWVAWAVLDWCNDQIPLWAGYLNSRASAHARAKLFTYEHIQTWLTLLVWIWRWIVLPAKVIPHALASAQWGWRLPWRRLIRFMLNWRWWPAVIVAALAGVALPSHFFVAEPHGTVSHQVWAMVLKLIGTFLLAVVSWVLLLAWAAVLLSRQPPLPESNAITELFKRLRLNPRWVGAQFGWVLAWIWVNAAFLYLPGWLFKPMGVCYRILITILALFIQAGMLRSLMSDHAKRVKLVWGTLALLVWGMLYLVAAELQDYLPGPIWQWLWAWVVTPIIFFPIAAVSAARGWRLPWRGILRVVCAWRWWTGVLLAGMVGKLAELYFDSLRGWPYVWKAGVATGLKMGAVDMLEMGIWILLVSWLVVLFERADGSAHPGDVAMHPVSVGSRPLGEDSADLPLPESGEGGGGNA